MTDRDAPAAAAEGADALGILLDAMMERHTALDGRPYLKCRDCACPSPMVVPHEQKHRAWCAVKRALLAARPAPPAAPREGYLTALDRLEAWWRDIAGATSLPYPGWRDDVMIVLRLAREAAREEGEG